MKRRLLLSAVTAVGRPTVAVVSMGRPYGLAAVVDQRGLARSIQGEHRAFLSVATVGSS